MSLAKTQGVIDMNLNYTVLKLVVLVLMLLSVVTGVAAAEELLNGFSGKVVDLEGKGVANFTFAIQPMRLHNGSLVSDEGFLPWRTDATGAFTVNDIQLRLVQLKALPDIPFDPEKEEFPLEFRRGRVEPDKEIVSIQIGKVTLFSMGNPDFSEGLTFALKPGMTIENLKVIVKPRLRIRGRVVYADSSPVPNTELDFDMEWQHETRSGYKGRSGAPLFTDADGYFVQYVDKPGFYTLSVEYNDLFAEAGPVLIKEDVQPEKIVLTLEGKLV